MGVVVARIYFMVKDRKGTMNQVSDHMSMLEDTLNSSLGKRVK